MDTPGQELASLRILFDVARTLDRHVELREALGPLLDLLENRAGLVRGAVTLLDRDSGMLRIEEARGLSAGEKARGRYRLGEGIVGRVFESGQPLVVPDMARDGRILNRAGRRDAKDLAGWTLYCLPIRSGQTVMGTLSAERRKQDDAETPASTDAATGHAAEDQSLLEGVASLIAESAKLRERILEDQLRSRAMAGDVSGTAPTFFHDTPVRSAVADTMAGPAGGRTSIESGELPGAAGTANAGTAVDSVAGASVATADVVLVAGSPILGTSDVMRAVHDMLARVAPSDATVLITGESGTGKEMAAAEVHRLSRRHAGPLVKVNCSALPESIIESELFGHEKGAYTGAMAQRTGRFELADGGTLFLDEIGDLSPAVQVKLLRALQEREIERVGGSRTIRVDVRVVAATNRNLEAEIAAGRFREDLYYRLNVFPVRMPPLRERRSDIVLLADHFAEFYAARNRKPIKRISSPALDLLTSYHWPGNVRELENCMERAVILSTDMVIHSYHLPPSLQSAMSTDTGPSTTLDAALSRLERELIVEALKMTGGNMAAAARRLGITERQMGLRVHHYGIPWRLYKPT